MTQSGTVEGIIDDAHKILTSRVPIMHIRNLVQTNKVDVRVSMNPPGSKEWISHRRYARKRKTLGAILHFMARYLVMDEICDSVGKERLERDFGKILVCKSGKATFTIRNSTASIYYISGIKRHLLHLWLAIKSLCKTKPVEACGRHAAADVDHLVQQQKMHNDRGHFPTLIDYIYLNYGSVTIEDTRSALPARGLWCPFRLGSLLTTFSQPLEW